jgi:chromosome segregation ATPase
LLFWDCLGEAILFLYWRQQHRFFTEDANMPKAIEDYKSPTHKVIAFLHQGRDNLRAKYTDLRTDFRVAQNQVRAVEKSRERWRQRAEAAEAELRALKKSCH